VTVIWLGEKEVVAYFKQMPRPAFMVQSGSRIIMLELNLVDGDADDDDNG
jgi:hypothetical protein